MNTLKKIFIGVSAPILFLLLIIFVVEIKTNQVLNDYSMLPSKPIVVDKVVLGRRDRGFHRGLYIAYRLEFRHGISKAFRRGAIELVCTNAGEILLVMKDYKYDYQKFDEAYLFITFRIEEDRAKGEVKINKMNFVSRDYFDTLVSDPLTHEEMIAILEALRQRASNTLESQTNRIGLGTMDGGNGFIGNAKTSNVEILFEKCKQYQ